jgi:hypothetical protein
MDDGVVADADVPLKDDVSDPSAVLMNFRRVLAAKDATEEEQVFWLQECYRMNIREAVLDAERLLFFSSVSDECRLRACRLVPALAAGTDHADRIMKRMLELADEICDMFPGDASCMLHNAVVVTRKVDALATRLPLWPMKCVDLALFSAAIPLLAKLSPEKRHEVVGYNALAANARLLRKQMFVRDVRQEVWRVDVLAHLSEVIALTVMPSEFRVEFERMVSATRDPRAPIRRSALLSLRFLLVDHPKEALPALAHTDESLQTAVTSLRLPPRFLP